MSPASDPVLRRAALVRLVDLGVATAANPAGVRWARTINVVALASMLINTAFAVFYLWLDYSSLWPVVVTNAAWNLGYVAVLKVNGRGRQRMAAWLLLVTGLLNTVIPGAVLGASTGVYLFLVLVPMLGVLISGPDDRLMRVVVISLGVAAFAFVPRIFPDPPAILVGSGLESVLFVSAAMGVGLFGSFFALYYRGLVEVAEAALEEANERSERLLLNILPAPIAERLKADESPIADRVDEVTVLFADLADSTPISEWLSADELVALLDRVFSHFDDLSAIFGLEKIATIGDGYLAASGIPLPRPDHIAAAAHMAIAMRDVLEQYEVSGYGRLGMRFGISTGPVVAGVIGRRKFRYDLWGDTVNTASRMQSQGERGMIQVTPEIYEALKDSFEFRPREPIVIKGKGLMQTYFLLRPRPARTLDEGLDEGVPIGV